MSMYIINGVKYVLYMGMLITLADYKELNQNELY